MVQFSGFASLSLCIRLRIHIAVWVSPFGHHRIKALLPAPRCFSQAYTSFVAYHRQGIHLMHLFAWLYHFKGFFEFIQTSVGQMFGFQTSLMIKFVTVLCVGFCLLYFRIRLIQSSPKSVPRISFQYADTVFVCWFRLSNLLKIDAAALVGLQIKKIWISSKL